MAVESNKTNSDCMQQGLSNILTQIDKWQITFLARGCWYNNLFHQEGMQQAPLNNQ